MNFFDQQIQLAHRLNSLVDFAASNRGPCFEQYKNDRAGLFRYLTFCMFTGRLMEMWKSGRPTALAVCWADWKEHVEARYAEGQPQFKWEKTHNGDCLFVAEVIGDRESVSSMWQAMIEKHPQLITVPVYTYRHRRLVLLSGRPLQRFLFGGRV